VGNGCGPGDSILEGTRECPFPYDPNNQFADAAHEGQWALESDGVTLGCFCTPYTKFGVTKYLFTLSQ
jgi:hypothetical protein